MNRDNVQAEYISRFARESEMAPVSGEELHSLSNEFQTVLPESYVSFTKEYGSVDCDGMLDSTVDLELDLWGVMSPPDGSTTDNRAACSKCSPATNVSQPVTRSNSSINRYASGNLSGN